MTIPIQISPCPIVEALMEIRFNVSVPQEAVFGLLYGRIKHNFSKFDPLPIVQIPENIRVIDQNLKYAPHYKMANNDLVLQIGPKVVNLSHTNGYKGWNYFEKNIIEIVDCLIAADIIKEIERVSVRYINLFNFNIFEKSDVTIKLREMDLGSTEHNASIISEILTGNVRNTLRLIAKAVLMVEGQVIEGSVIDIDSVYTSSVGNNKDEILMAINRCHTEEKNVFFSVLNKEYINTLNPVYT